MSDHSELRRRAAKFDPECVNRLRHLRAFAVFGEGQSFDDASAVIECLEAFPPEVVVGLLDEIDQLKRWKVEAIAVLGKWDEVWQAAGRPGQIGESMASGVLGFVRAAGSGEPK